MAINLPPCTVSYEARQIDDIKRFCTSTRGAILGIDRTFNLGHCYVTVTTFKFLDAVRQRTNEPPVFLGPTYLHWDATVTTYANFLHHLRVKLACNVDTGITVAPDLMVGSDDERALRNALAMVFPKSSHLLCIQHLRKNVEHYLTDKIGQTSQMRRRIADDIL